MLWEAVFVRMACCNDSCAMPLTSERFKLVVGGVDADGLQEIHVNNPCQRCLTTAVAFICFVSLVPMKTDLKDACSQLSICLNQGITAGMQVPVLCFQFGIIFGGDNRFTNKTFGPVL
eukprot:1139900-Pelagomonas_calceolata.AAC.6